MICKKMEEIITLPAEVAQIAANVSGLALSVRSLSITHGGNMKRAGLRSTNLSKRYND